jgi:citrate lyase beta subunit
MSMAGYISIVCLSVVAAVCIVAVFSDPQHAASNVVNLDGRMVERLHYEQAVRLLAIHARTSGADQGS